MMWKFLNPAAYTSIYNYDFDIAAIIIYILLFLFYVRKKHVRNTPAKLFVALFSFAIMTPVLDIVSCMSIEYHLPWITVVVLNTLYFVFLVGSAAFFMGYLTSHFEMSDKRLSLRKGGICLPYVIMLAFIASNPWTGLVFTYPPDPLNAGRFIFKFGPVRNVCFAVIICYFVFSLIYILRQKEVTKKRLKALISAISVFNTCVAVAQMCMVEFYGDLLMIQSFSMAISLLVFHLTLDNYGIELDSNTGMATRRSIEYVVRRLITSRHSFHFLVIRMADYDLLNRNYGIVKTYQMVEMISQELMKYTVPGRGFITGKSGWALVISRKEDIKTVQESIYNMLKKSWNIGDTEMVSEFYISAVTYPEETPGYENLVRFFQSFETANLYQHYGIVSPQEFAMNDKQREYDVEKAIERALTEGNFDVYYQPICTSRDRRFMTAEALVRLKDPELGFISPAEFIPIAEQSNSIIKVGNYVLETVCKFIETHDMDALGLEYIEVNLSVVQVLQSDLIETIDRITSAHGVSANRICFEITETASNFASPIFAQNLRMLNERGYSLALDDFGTGYGNLQRMITSEFKLIKFDREMTKQLSSGEQMQNVYTKLQGMIKSLGSEIVSEGIETKEQYDFVRDAGSSYIQGYYFSKPLPESDFLAFLENKARES